MQVIGTEIGLTERKKTLLDAFSNFNFSSISWMTWTGFFADYLNNHYQRNLSV